MTDPRKFQFSLASIFLLTVPAAVLAWAATFSAKHFDPLWARGIVERQSLVVWSVVLYCMVLLPLAAVIRFGHGAIYKGLLFGGLVGIFYIVLIELVLLGHR